jgi:hypothetical protein
MSRHSAGPASNWVASSSCRPEFDLGFLAMSTTEPLQRIMWNVKYMVFAQGSQDEEVEANNHFRQSL